MINQHDVDSRLLGGDRPAHGAGSKVRKVTAIYAGKAGTSELHLECGHVLRRRLALCPPRKVICPNC